MRRWRVAAFALACACASGSNDDDNGTAGLGGSTAGRAETGADDDAGSDAASGANTSSAGSDTAAGADTGIPAGCGDGTRDADEQCDDGNLEEGDGCNPDCRLSGQVQWQHFGAAGFGLDDDANDVAVAADGSVYMVGYTSNVGDLDDQWLRKLSDVGGMLWTEVVDGPSMGNDQLRGIVLDAEGSIYVGGYINVMGEGANLFVRKYDEYGDPQWTDTSDGGATGSDVVNHLAFDPAGNLMATGYVQTAAEGRDAWIRKYSPAGAVLWTRTWSGQPGEDDQAWDIAPAADGHYYVVGETANGAEAGNTWVAKFDIDGNVLWTRSHNGEAGLGDRFRGVAAADDGVVVCGYEDHDAYPWQIFIRKYDAAGSIEWTIVDAGGSSEGAHCFGVERAPNGDFVWVGGELFNGVRHAVVGRLAPDGTPRWRSVLPAMSDGPDFGRDLDFAADGSIIVAGRVDAGVDGNDAWVASLTP
jgi:uncharacterized delta-60 repeat protein